MKKKIVKKVAKISVRKSTKTRWHTAVPLRWSYFSISIMTVLAAVAIVLPQVGVLGASTKAPQVDLQIAMKNGSSVTLPKGQGITIGISEVTVPKETKKINPVFYTTLRLPFTYTFAAVNGAGYNVYVEASSHSNYTVLNRYRYVNVKNGKSPCVQGAHNPCTFYVVAGEKISPKREATPTPKPYTCTSKGGICVAGGQFRGEHMAHVNGTCKPGLICAK